MQVMSAIAIFRQLTPSAIKAQHRCLPPYRLVRYCCPVCEGAEASGCRTIATNRFWHSRSHVDSCPTLFVVCVTTALSYLVPKLTGMLDWECEQCGCHGQDARSW